MFCTSEGSGLSKGIKEARKGRESATLALSPDRKGPLLDDSSGSLHAVAVAMEHYQLTVAENDSNRWRMASIAVGSQVGVLPALRRASEQTAERAYRRERH